MNVDLRPSENPSLIDKILSGMPDGNLRWYIENQNRLVWLYEGYHLVIVDKRVVGMFTDAATAEKWAWDKFYDADVTCIKCEHGTRQYYLDLTR